MTIDKLTTEQTEAIMSATNDVRAADAELQRAQFNLRRTWQAAGLRPGDRPTPDGTGIIRAEDPAPPQSTPANGAEHPEPAATPPS